MNPLLAITAAKLGSHILGSIAGNSAEKAPSAAEMKKASEPFDLKFLPDGSVALKKADGTEKIFKLDGNLKDTAQKAVSLIESAKIAYPSGLASSKESGGSMQIVPGAKATLQA